MFQSTHPHGVRLWSHIRFIRFYSFNPRTHTGCDSESFPSSSSEKGFNPRTHTGCDDLAKRYSIEFVFQSTHPHGVRRSWPPQFPFYSSSFNPRTHTGCDGAPEQNAPDILVSIHAPTRGATPPIRHKPRSVEVSIHAPTRGATPDVGGTAANKAFQSTHPHGVRRIFAVSTIKISYVSIHAPTRGATSGLINLIGIDLTFQSTHPHGVRRYR